MVSFLVYHFDWGYLGVLKDVNCYAFPRLMLGKLWKELHCGFVTGIGSGNMTLSNPDISISGSNCWTILFEVPKSRHEVNVEPPAASTARISSRDLFCKVLPLRFAHFMIFISQGGEFIFQQFIWTLLLSNASWHLKRYTFCANSMMSRIYL